MEFSLFLAGGVPLLPRRGDPEEHAAKRVARIQSVSRNVPPEEQAWQFLTLARYRRGSRSLSETARERVLCQLRETVRRDLEISFTLCFLPVKVRNPLKTFAREGTEVDLGEAGALLRLHEIAIGLQMLLGRPAHARISSDGMRYADVLGYAPPMIRGYQSNLRLLIDALGIHGTVRIVDEAELLPLDWNQSVSDESAAIQKELSGSGPVGADVSKLEPSIALCIDLGPDISPRDVQMAFAVDLDDAQRRSRYPSAGDLRELIERRTRAATIGYIAANRVMLRRQVFATCWPLTVKGTVHPKAGEIGLYPVNCSTDNVFPYHGQGYFSPETSENIDGIRIGFASDLRREHGDRLHGIVLDPQHHPFSNGVHPFVVQYTQ